MDEGISTDKITESMSLSFMIKIRIWRYPSNPSVDVNRRGRRLLNQKDISTLNTSWTATALSIRCNEACPTALFSFENDTRAAKELYWTWDRPSDAQVMWQGGRIAPPLKIVGPEIREIYQHLLRFGRMKKRQRKRRRRKGNEDLLRS